MLAHTLSAPPQSAQVKMSTLNTRFNRCAHVIDTWRAGDMKGRITTLFDEIERNRASYALKSKGASGTDGG